MDIDPFLEVKRDVETNLEAATETYKKLKFHLSSNSTQIAKETLSELNSLISTITEDTEDLSETIKVAEANPFKFHLSNGEIRQRKEFISSAERNTQELTRLSRESDAAIERSALLTSGSRHSSRQGTSTSGDNPFAASNKRFLDSEIQEQQQLMYNQDRQMGDVLHTVSGLKEVAHVMGRELDDQSRLLDEMELQADTTANKLGHASKKVAEFIKANSSSKQQYTIICLIIALVILLMLVIST